MKYVLMINTDERAEETVGPDDLQGILERHTAVTRALHASGKWVSAARLRYSAEARTIRGRGADTIVLDGPFAETKELLGGFYLIEAGSKEEALEWAQQLPLREQGSIEVRPARTGATWHGSIRPSRKFAVLFIADADQPLSRAQVFDAIDAHYELSLELAAQGKFVSSRSLEPPTAATTVRWRNGRHLITDGPFAECKEAVAGFFVIACDDGDEAIAWARQLMVGSAACEVRPVWEAA